MRKPVQVAVALLALVAAVPGRAEERYKKWLFELSIGGYDPADEVRSNAANLSQFTDENGVITFTPDPRPNFAQKSAMKIDSTARLDFRVGYGLAEWGWGELIIDGGFGYIDGSISALEVAFRVCDESPDPNVCAFKIRKKDLQPIELPFHTSFLRAGDLRQIPVSLNGLVRFRPTKRLNPYVGIGAGRLYVEFEEDEEFTEVAEFLDRSRGQGRHLEGDTFAFGPERDVPRPRVEAPDTVFYEARAGMEFQLTPKWSLYLDARYEWAGESVEVTVGDDFTLGRATPNEETDVEWPSTLAGGTSFKLTVPGPKGPGNYRQYPDSVGYWYVEGGELDYGGFSAGFGARFSF